MTKNQKIAAGCGALGCLGLIVLAVATVLGYIYLPRRAARSYIGNTNVNSNYNSNGNSNRNANEPSNSSAPKSAGETPSSMTDEDKHKLFQAAGMLKDPDAMQKVLKQIGIVNGKGVPTDEYPAFLNDHIFWASKNESFINSVNTEETAREYVNAHLAN
jgi:hypothetical protein